MHQQNERGSVQNGEGKRVSAFPFKFTV